MQADESTERDETFPLLRQTELRKCLSDVQLKELERFCRSSVRKGGTTVFRQGEPADGLYMVLEGSIELRARPPGRRVYRKAKEMRPVLGGMGITIISTSSGIFSDREARQKNIGGEVLCEIY